MIAQGVAVVTGAGTGIGLACAEKLVERSFEVLAVVRDREPSFEQLAESSSVRVITSDFEQDSDIRELVRKLECIPADVLINCAGMFDSGTAEDQVSRIAEALRVFRVNVVVPELLIRTLLPHMRERGQGSIVNVSSIGAKYGSGSGSVFYGASKRALEALTLSFSREEAPNGIRVNTVRPSVVDTEFPKRSGKSMEKRVTLIPLGRVASASEVAEEIIHLAVDSSFITGHSLAVSGGE